MKTVKLGLLASATCMFGVISVGGTARADDFPQTTAIERQSLTGGFNQSPLAILYRTGAPDLNKMSAALEKKLCPAPCLGVRTSHEGSTLRITDDHWSLEIIGDGSAAQFRDLEIERRSHSLAKPLSQKMSASVLEKVGRAFITSKLGSVIVLGPEEELFPVRTDYRIEGEQNLKTRQVIRSVVANRIVFGRILHGVPVVGGGSTVILTFANDGSVESFRYDWPKYRTANSQAVVGTGEILNRLQKVIAVRKGVAIPTFTVSVPSNQAYPIPLTSDTALQKLECGYYDPGAAARNIDAPIQPGCVYRAVQQGADGMRRGFAGAVPAGNPFEPDKGWAENAFFLGVAPARSPAPGSANSH